MINTDKTKEQLLNEINKINDKISLQERDILDYKQTIGQIQDEYKITNIALDTQLDTFFLFDPITSKAVQWNKSFVKISGYTDDEIEKLPAPASYYSPEDLIRAGKFIQNILKGNSGTIELELICKDGQKIPFEYQVVAINDEKGEPKNLISIGRNITERKEADEALRSSEKKFSKLFQTSPNVLVISSLEDGRIIDMNEEGLRNLGYKRDEIIGKTRDEIRLIDIEDVKKLIEMIQKDSYYSGVELKVRLKDGSEKYGLFHGQLIEIGGKSFLFQTIVDMTERKQIEEKLKESEDRFRTLYENSTIGLYRSTPDGQILLANPTLIKMLGYSSFDELAERNLEKIGYAPSYERKIFIEQIEKNGEVKGLETAWIRVNGSTIYVRESARKILDAKGKTLYYDGTVEDITERKQAIKKLVESEKRYHQFFNHDLSGDFISTPDGKLIECNKAFLNIFGFSTKKEALQANSYGLYYSKKLRDEKIRQLKKKKKLINYEEILKKINGEKIHVVSNILGEFDSDGNLIYLKGYVLDITERKQAEEKLKSRNRELETWAEVTTGRELFMINLKKEINELLDKSGEKPKYKIPI